MSSIANGRANFSKKRRNVEPTNFEKTSKTLIFKLKKSLNLRNFKISKYFIEKKCDRKLFFIKIIDFVLIK